MVWVWLSAVLLLLCAHCAQAQPPQKVNSNYQFRGVGSDSGGVRLPKYQSVLPVSPNLNYVDSGALAYRKSDSAVYVWTGHQWILVKGAGAVPANPNRSVQFNNGGSFGGNNGFRYETDSSVRQKAGQSGFVFKLPTIHGDTATGNSMNGNYYHTLQESTENPDGSADMVYNICYNCDANSQPVNTHDGIMRIGMESGWDPGSGVDQFEFHCPAWSRPGHPSDDIRLYSTQMHKNAIYALSQWRSQGYTWYTTAGDTVAMNLSTDGALQVAGYPNNTFIQIGERGTDHVLQMQPTGAGTFFVSSGRTFNFDGDISINKQSNVATSDPLFQIHNPSSGTSALTSLSMQGNGFTTWFSRASTTYSGDGIVYKPDATVLECQGDGDFNVRNSNGPTLLTSFPTGGFGPTIKAGANGKYFYSNRPSLAAGDSLAVYCKSQVDSAIGGHTLFSPTTGGTVSVVNGHYNVVNPATPLLNLTITFPSSPANNSSVEIKFTQSITTVSYTGGTVVGAPTSNVLGYYKYKYDSNTLTWY